MNLSRGVLFLLLLALVGLGVVWQELRVLEIRMERARLEKAIEKLKSRQIVLQAEIEELATPGRMTERVGSLGVELGRVRMPRRERMETTGGSRDVSYDGRAGHSSPISLALSHRAR